LRYDLDLVVLACAEAGLPSKQDGECVAIPLGQRAVLLIQNIEADDCMIGFEGTPWHIHDNPTFAGPEGYVEMEYFDLPRALSEGKVLVCERHQHGELVDRWLVHHEVNDEFKYLERGEELRIWRAKGNLES
jgi:hypothetical protein